MTASSNARILVIDDERGIRTLCADVLGRAGYSVEVAATAAEGLAAAVQGRFALVLCDINLPDETGLQVLPHLLAVAPAPAVVLITAFPSIDTAVRGMKLGARDYLAKPFGPDELRMVVARALAEDELRQQHQALKSKLAYGAMLGESPVMVALRDTIERAATSDATVLITGESGTGKELVARALHFAGRRASAPFVPVNCGALVGNLLESELFGHVRGAFTGADTAKRGLFVMADGGTLVLDEIGELPMDLQPKLLRALAAGEVKPVGATQPSLVDTRVIGVTNRNLPAAVAAGTFREDLYYRLMVIAITVPSLRERRSDIPLLAHHFAESAAVRAERSRPDITPAAIDFLTQQPWRGNVRELENCVERAVILARSHVLDVADFAPLSQMTPATATVLASPDPDARICTLDELERDHILRTLAHVGGQKSRAATLLGINRTTLWKKLRLYGLDEQLESHGTDDAG